MTPDQEEHARDLISLQLEMAATTLAELRGAGYQPSTLIAIEFSLDAPSRSAADALAGHLEQNDCSSVSVEDSGGLLAHPYRVEGKTLPTEVTTEVLSEWIPWIVTQGVVRGCTFDGWWVEVPAPTA